MMLSRFLCVVLAVSFVGCSRNDGKTSSSDAHTANIFQLLWHEASYRFDPDATYKIGQKHEYGDEVPPSNYEAIQWYKKSYRLGNPKAGIALVRIYKTDETLRNGAEAEKILKKLSEQGNKEAQELYKPYLKKTNGGTDE